MANTRVKYIDIAKGIGILAVVVGHSLQNGSFPLRLIYSFHMPLFFFLAGMCYNSGKYTFVTLLRKRSMQLLMPLVLFSVILSLLRIPILQYPAHFSWLGLFPFSLWFVFILFITELVGFFTVKQTLFLSILIGGLSVILYYFDIRLPYSLSCLPAAVMFYGLGYKWKSHKFSLKHIKNGGGNCLIESGLALIVIGYSYFCPVYLDMCSNVMPLISVGIALCGISIVIACSRQFNDNKFVRLLVFLGRNTFIIMAVHQFFMYIASVYVKPILCNGFLEIALYKIAQQVIMWSGVLITIWVINNKAKWILGK